MLEEIMNHIGPRVSQEKAREILEAEANPSWISNLYLFVPIGLFGYIASTFGSQDLMIFLGLAICIVAVDNRNRRKRSTIAKAVIALTTVTPAEDPKDGQQAQQDETLKP